MQLLAVLLAVFSVGSALKLPNYIKPCARNDPDFNECARKHAQDVLRSSGFAKGERKYNLPPLDPLIIPNVKVSNGDSLTLKLRDLHTHGLLDSVVDNTLFDFDKQHIKLELTVPKKAEMAKYDVEGKISVLPIKGSGDLNYTEINTHITFECDYTLEQKRDGKMYMVVSNPKATSTPERVSVHLTNLFNGNELLGKQMNEFLNENWQEIYKAFGPAFGEVIATTAHSIINSIANNVPFDEVFPET